MIILPLQSAAPAPATASFQVRNDRTTTRSLIHADGFNTRFVEVQFPAGSLASLDGTPLGGTDSVLVTLRAEAGTYGVDISPDGLRFTATARPTVTFSYVRYGDLSVASGTRYSDQNAYASALEIWREVGFDLWSNTGGTGTVGTDLRTTIPESGRYIAAAPR